MNPAKRVSPKHDRAGLTDLRVKSAVKAMMDAVQSPKWFAAERGIAHETLLHKLSPTGERNYHSQELWEDLHLAGPESVRPVLDTICQEFAGVFVPVPERSPNGKDAEDLMLIATAEFGKVVQSFLNARDPRGPGGKQYTQAEWDACYQALQHALPAFFQIGTYLRRRASQGEGD